MTTFRPPKGRAVHRHCRCGAEVLVGRDPLDEKQVIAVDYVFLTPVGEAHAQLAGRAVYELDLDHAGHSWLALRSPQGTRRRVLGLEPRQDVLSEHRCSLPARRTP